ncbi:MULTISPECIES: Vomp family autotransporter [unclassified Bartonella]|uniref:Vomp family autotransporter n=1 Tax=unclassified Bartonella TaxID=2645622 RepID=UPI0035CFE67B
MKKKYSTPNLIKVVSLSTVMATLLSSVSPVFAANLAITGQTVKSSNMPQVEYPHGSHGSVVFAGDDDYCGADNVIGRGGKQQQAIPDTGRITAEQQYNRFITDQEFNGRHPYGTTTEQVIWGGDGYTTSTNGRVLGGYMGGLTGGIANAMPEAYGVYSFATGCGSAATGNYSTVFGAGATAKAGGAQAFGVSALASGIASVAMGVGSEASGKSAVAFGGLATASGKNSISIGVRSQATLDDAIAVGSDATASGINSVAIGKFASASGYNSVALGLKTKASNDYTVAIGSKAEAEALGSIAIGGGEPAENGQERKVIAKGKNSIAIGSHTYAETAHSVAIGINAQVHVIDGVAVGGGSVSRVDGKVLGYDPVTNTTTTKSDLAWKSTAGDFSVGNTNQNLTRQITNVAAGSKDTDAVNVAQLKAMRDVIAGGGAWKLSANDTNPIDVNSGNVVDFSVKSEKEAGKDNLKIAKNTTENKHKIEFTLNDHLKLTKVSTGQSTMSDDGFFVNGGNGSRMTVDGFFINGNDGPSMTIDGIDAAKQKITNVADGEKDTDAVNYKQLKAVQDATKTSWQLAVNGGNATAIGPNGTVNFQSADNNGAKNIKIEKDKDNTVTFDLADDIQVMTVTAGESIMSAVGFGFTDGNGPSITVNGIHAGDKTIKGVAAGEEDTDAVNYKQLKDFTAGMATGWKLSVDGNNATDVKAGSTVDLVADAGEDGSKNIKIAKDSNKVTFSLNDTLKLTSVTTGNSIMSNDGFKFVDGGPSITVNGIDAGGKKITKVKAGTDDTDAVNYKQLQDFTAGIKTGWKLSVDGDNATDVGAESIVQFVAAADKDDHKNLKIVRGNNNEVTFDLNEFITVKKIKVGSEVTINNSGLVIRHGPSITYGGIDAGDKVIRRVAEGILDTDAVNLTQLKIVEEKIKEVADNSLVKWKEDQKLITIGAEKGGTKIDITGTEGERTIAGVKNGEISKDSMEAVNGSQINTVAGDVAKFFGGDAAFQDGAFVGPRYNLSKVSADGSVEQKTFENVGDALTELDANVKNVNSRIKYVDNKFDKFSQDALLWDDGKQAFAARHEKDGRKTDSKITYLLNGDISEESTDAINGSQLYKMGDKIANYFGGGAKYENGEWIDPTFKVSQRNEDGTIVEKKHHNVADAFEGVDSSITDIYNQINNVTENSLVKQEGEDGLITVGKATGGTEISLVNKDNQERTLSGVKDGELSQTSTQAVNGSQLFATDKKVTTVTDNLKTVAQNTSKYFGGSTDVLNGVEPAFLIQGKTYHNVTEAFTGVNTSITNIDNKISDVVKNSLVKQEKNTDVITIGKDTAGTEINIAGYAGVARSISGVKAAEKGDEAVNKDQLDKSIKDITKDIETVTAAAVLYDKNDDNSVNYGSVTLGGDKNNGPVALHNIKDGSISENSNDAINGSQINKISADIAKFFGGGAKFINGAFEGLKYTLSAIVGGEVGKANFYNVGDALTGLDKNVQDVNQRLTNVSNEFNQKIEDFSKDALLWDDEEEAFVARHGKDGKKTNSKLKYLLDGEIAQGSTDAITGNQLYSMNNQLANYFGGGAKYENGKWTDPTFKIVQVNADGTTVETEHHNVADAFGDVNKNMSNINNRIDDVINKVDSDALKWNDKEKAYDAGRDGKPNKIINVADGKVEKGSKDAVNGGQLWETNERVTGVEKDVKHLTNRVDTISNTIADIGDTVINIDAKVDNINNRVDGIEEDAVRYDRDENGKKTNKITLAGGDASEPVLIDNVADGKIEKGSKEAVNGGQLHDYTKEQMKIILDESKQYTDQRVNNIVIDAIDDAVDRAKQYTDMKFDILNYSIESVKKEARQAAAIGLAVSNLRYNDTPGKLSVGFGTGLWRSQSAFAFGAGYTSENGKYRSNISATTSGGHWGIGAGFNMTLN